MSEERRQQVRELVIRIADGDNDDDVEAALDELNRLVAHSAPSDVIFHSDGDRSVDEMVDEILAYKPILL